MSHDPHKKKQKASSQNVKVHIEKEDAEKPSLHFVLCPITVVTGQGALGFT